MFTGVNIFHMERLATCTIYDLVPRPTERRNRLSLSLPGVEVEPLSRPSSSTLTSSYMYFRIYDIMPRSIEAGGI